MKAGQAFIGIILDISLENFEQVRSLVEEWNSEYGRMLEFGYGLGDKTETWVSAFLEPDTPVFAFDVLMDKLKLYALPGTLGVGGCQAPPLLIRR